MWFSRRKYRGQVAFGIQPEGIACAWFTPTKQGQSTLKACEFIEGKGEALAKALETWVGKHRVKGLPCRLVLDPSHYRIHQIEAPSVPEEELPQAIRWRVKELIDYPLEQAVVDYLDIPQRRQGNQQLVYAVSAREDIVGNQLATIRRLGIKPRSVDIAEMTLRNLARLLPEDSRGVLMLYLDNHQGMINIYADGTLYLTRRLEVGAQQLSSSLGSSEEGEMQLDTDQDPAVDNLVLEIQRSLDYYERQFSQKPINSLVVSPTEPALPKLMGVLNSRLGVISRQMDLTALFECDSKPDDRTQMQCLTSVGAALREVKP